MAVASQQPLTQCIAATLDRSQYHMLSATRTSVARLPIEVATFCLLCIVRCACLCPAACFCLWDGSAIIYQRLTRNACLCVALCVCHLPAATSSIRASHVIIPHLRAESWWCFALFSCAAAYFWLLDAVGRLHHHLPAMQFKHLSGCCYLTCILLVVRCSLLLAVGRQRHHLPAGC